MANAADVQEALKRGYTLDEIADIETRFAGYDPVQVRERGYSTDEMLEKIGIQLLPQPSIEPPASEQGAVGSLWTGAKQLVEMGRATGNVLTSDNADVEAGRERFLKNEAASTPEKRAFMQDYLRRTQADVEKDGEAGWIDAFGNMAASAWENPTGFGHAMAEQAPNAVPVLAAGAAGAKLGSMAGTAVAPGLGTTIGAIGGGFLGMALGNAGIEIGAKAIDKAEGGLTDAESSEALTEGAVKGTVIAGVDIATLGLSGAAMKAIGKTAIKAGAMAEARVLADAGVDLKNAADIAQALADPALKKAAQGAGRAAARAELSLGQKAAMVGTGLGLETVGEGAGEYLGEMAATGKGDKADAMLEAFMGAGQSAVETAWNFNRTRGNDLAMRGIMDAGRDVISSPSVDAAIATASESLDAPLALPLHANNPLVAFPDGSVGTQAQYDEWRLSQMVEPADPELNRPRELSTSAPEVINTGEDPEFAALLKDEQMDVAYRRREAIDQATKATQLNVMREQAQTEDADAQVALSQVNEAPAEPTAMQLAFRAAQQKAQAPQVVNPPATPDATASMGDQPVSLPLDTRTKMSDSTPAAIPPSLSLTTSRRGSPIVSGNAEAVKAAEPLLRQALPDVTFVPKRDHDGYALVVSKTADRAKIQSVLDAINSGVSRDSPVGSAVPEVDSSRTEGESDQPGGSIAPELVRGRSDPPSTGRGNEATGIPVPGSTPDMAAGSPANGPKLRAHPKVQAQYYAQRFTAQGLPSAVIPHPTEAGQFAIVPADEVANYTPQPVTTTANASETVGDVPAAPVAPVETPIAPVTRTRGRPAANSLLQAIVNRGGINREIMSDVGADPARRYMPGLFTQNGTRDLSSLAQYLADEDGFIIPESDIGQARELEDMVSRAIVGETILSAQAMERAQEAEESRRLKGETLREANALGIRGVAGRRTLAVVEAEIAREVEARAEWGKQHRIAAELAKDAMLKAESLEKGMRALGFTEKEIQEELQRDTGTQESAGPGATEGSQSRTAVGREDGETGTGAPSTDEGTRPSLALTGQSDAEIRASEARQRAAEAVRRAEEAKADAAERQQRVDVEVASRQGIAAENFTLDAQVNNKTEQKKADAKRIEEQLAGQGDLLASAKPITETAQFVPKVTEFTIAGKTWRITVQPHYLTGELAWSAERQGNRGDWERVAGDDVPVTVANRANAFVENVKNAEDGDLLPPAKPLAEMTPADLLREAARKLDEAATAKVGASRGNTEDAGEELTYNQRNRRAAGLKWDDIAEQEAALRVKEVTKAKVYPKPDYAALAGNDQLGSKVIAHLIKQVYDAIASAPVSRGVVTDNQLQTYIEAVNRVMDGVIAWGKDATFVSTYRLAANDKTLMEAIYPDGWRSSREEAILLGGNKFLSALQPGYDEIKRAERDIDKGWPSKREAWQTQGFKVVETAESVKVRPTNVDGKYYLSVDGHYAQGFANEDEANAALEKLQPWLLLNKNGRLISQHASGEAATEAAREATKRDGKEAGVSDKGIKVTAAERTGIAHRAEGEDITSDRLVETFGFKGVNFGTWMKGKGNETERQLHLNHAYDSFMDLAQIMGVPPKAMSLNGMLGIAFGAQGRAGAAAHFVPGVNEINLTRESGAGSLGHEFGHALDHYFARLGGLDRQAEPFLTEHIGKPAQSGLRPEVLQKFKAVVTAMNQRPMTQEEHAKQEADASNRLKYNIDSWLKAIRRGFETTAIPKTTPADSEIRRNKTLAKFDEIAGRIKALNVGDGLIRLSSTKAVYPAIAELRELHKDVFGRTMSLDESMGLQSNVQSLVHQAAKQEGERSHIPQLTKTDYARNAAKLDKEKGGKAYWNTNLEKFARAFDAFLTDTLAEQTAKNSYLSHYGRTGDTVPGGTEREAINEAFRDLINTLQTRETDQGIALESRKAPVARLAPNDKRGTTLTNATPTQIRASLVRTFGEKTIASLEAKGLLRILADAEEAPEGVTFSDNATAKIVGETAYLVANRMTPATAKTELLHELGTHYGLERMLGEKGWNALVRRIELMHRAKNKAVREAYAYVAEFYPEYAEGSWEHMQEVLAHIGQDADVQQQSWWRDMLATVKRWLMQLGYAIPISHSDVQDMVLHSLKTAARDHIADTSKMVPALASKAKQLSRDTLPIPARESSSSGQGKATGDESESDTTVSPVANKDKAGTPAPDSRPALESRSAITGQQIQQSWQAPEVPQWDNFVRTMQDKLIDTKRVLTEIRKAGVAIKDSIDPYLQETLYHGRAAKRVHDFADNELRPLLVEMAARGIEMQEFEDYLWARHATERNAQIAKVNPKMPDGGSGLTNQQAADILAGQSVTVNGRAVQLTPARMAGYQSLAKRIDAINTKTLGALVGYGLETQDTVNAWRSAYSQYVPLKRDMETDDNYAGAFGLGNGTGQGFSVRGSSVKRAMGSERDVTGILANIAMQRENAIVRGEKNRVAQSLYGLSVAAPNPDFWLPINPDAQRDPATVVAELVNMGMNPIDAENIATEPKQQYVDPRTGLVTERINPALRGRADVLGLRVGGKDRFVMFSSDERAQHMVSNLKNLEADQLGAVMQKMAVVTRWFASINTQYNPIFGLTNGLRDLGTGLLNLSSTDLKGQQADLFKQVWSALTGIYIDLRDHRKGIAPTSVWAKEFEEFQREGGQTGYRDMFQTSKARAEDIATELKNAGKGQRWLAWGEKHSHIFGWLSDYNTAIENAVRLSAYKLGKEQGMSKAQAAALAKNLTVNFNKKGLAATQAGAMYAFFNAAVQGTARIGQTMLANENGEVTLTGAGRKILYGGMMAGVMQAVMFALAGWDDEEPPQFVRERNFIIPLPDGKYLSVPYPLGFHVIPNIGRIAGEFALSGFKKPGQRLVDMASMFMDAFNPIGSASGSVGQMISPTVGDPVIALGENKDWTGRPIYKEDFSKLTPTPGWTRSKDSASWLSKQLAYGINYVTGGGKYEIGLLSPTPDQLDYLIGQGTGGVGRESLKIWQTAQTGMSGEELPMYKVPVLGRFVGETTGQSAETSRFYENLKRIGEHKSAIDVMRDAGDSEARVRYFAEHPEARLVHLAGQASRDISKLKAQKRKLMEADASRERIQLIESQIERRVKQWNERLKERQPVKEAA